MGLLPTGTGDWLAFETRGVVRFFSFLCTSSFVSVPCVVLFLGVSSQSHFRFTFLVTGDIAPVN